MVPLREKIQRLGTGTYTVVDILGAQTVKLVAQDNGGPSPDHNGNNVPPIGTQTPDGPESSALELWLCSAGGTGGRYGAVDQKGSVATYEEDNKRYVI